MQEKKLENMGDQKEMELIKQLPTVWQEYWQELGYQAPSPIQSKSYPLLLEKTNLVGVSPTGSGKTVAYLLPLLQQITIGEGNQLLILLPSQELAVQVATVTKNWAERLDISVESLIGGANVKRQVEKLKAKPEVLVGTPGRVYELIKAKKLKAHLLKMVVLDEVDQLIQTNELNATKNILKAIDNQSQLVCVSATAVDIKEQLAANWHSEFTLLDVSAEDQSAGVVTHGFIKENPRKKVDLLRRLSHLKGFKGIIFFNELQEMGYAAEKLSYQGVPNATLASDQNKLERRLALSAFAENKVSLLLTTDIAARGLDFDKLPYVIHYNVPYNQEGYVHRSGRTGRMGEDGAVISLVDDYELKDLKKITRQQAAPLVELMVYSGALVPITPEIKEQLAEGKANPVSPKKSKSAVPKEQTAKQNASEPVRRKKKSKQKDQKNKGARKKTQA